MGLKLLVVVVFSHVLAMQLHHFLRIAFNKKKVVRFHYRLFSWRTKSVWAKPIKKHCQHYKINEDFGVWDDTLVSVLPGPCV